MPSSPWRGGINPPPSFLFLKAWWAVSILHVMSVLNEQDQWVLGTHREGRRLCKSSEGSAPHGPTTLFPKFI